MTNSRDDVSGGSGDDEEDEVKTFESLFSDSEFAPSFLHATVN